MVILTLTTTENPHTVYFDQPIQKPSYIRLLSCSLYNSWNSLEKDGIIFYKKANKQDEETSYIQMGNYSLDDIGDIFEKRSPEKDFLTVEKGITGRSLIIEPKKPTIKTFGLNESLIKFFNLPGYKNSAIEKDHFITIVINDVSLPKHYFVNCDLIDKQQSLLNGKPSSLLACFDIRGEPYEKIHYQNTHLNALRDVSADNHVTHMTLSVTDENNNRLLNFNGWPLNITMSSNVLPSAPDYKETETQTLSSSSNSTR